MKFAEIFISRWMLITARCFLLLVCLFLFFAVSEWSSKFTVHCSKPDYFEYFHCQQWRSRMDGGKLHPDILLHYLCASWPKQSTTPRNQIKLTSNLFQCAWVRASRYFRKKIFAVVENDLGIDLFVSRELHGCTRNHPKSIFLSTNSCRKEWFLV